MFASNHVVKDGMNVERSFYRKHLQIVVPDKKLHIDIDQLCIIWNILVCPCSFYYSYLTDKEIKVQKRLTHSFQFIVS